MQAKGKGPLKTRMETGHFFFYGTLQSACGTPLSREIRQSMELLGRGSIGGTLYPVELPRGAYPVLVDGEGRVSGECWRMTKAFTPDHLNRLDAYEGYLPGDETGSLYLRVVRPVQLVGGRQVPAFCYLYNRPVPAGAEVIADGDYLAWLSRNKSIH